MSTATLELSLEDNTTARRLQITPVTSETRGGNGFAGGCGGCACVCSCALECYASLGPDATGIVEHD